MSDTGKSMRGPIGFLAAALLIETLCVAFASAGSGLARNILLALGSMIQVVTLILVWYIFRMLIVVHKHVTNIEQHQPKP